MNNTRLSDLPTTRREFLKSGAGGVGLLAFSQFAPAFLTNSVRAAAPSPEKDRSILVLVQLAGGNDGLNTVVPYSDDDYHRLRPGIGLKKKDIVAINDDLGFHNACEPLANLHRDGKLSIVQNVGYPNPNRSHFRSSEIWETASKSDEFSSTGWLGRYFDNECSGAPRTEGNPVGVHVTNQLPQAFLSEEPQNLFGMSVRNQRRSQMKEEDMQLLESVATAPADGENANFLQHVMMDALATERRIQKMISGYRPMADYPGTGLSQSLRKVAAMISQRMETRVYFVTLGGFDTHTSQSTRHPRLLTELSEAMAAFQKDLEKHGIDDQVLTMTFSEFGRRPSENNGGGTDHGTAAPLFVMGSGLNKNLVGQAPSLKLAKNKDLTYSTDFRQVYSTILDRWLGCDANKVLDGNFGRLDFLA